VASVFHLGRTGGDYYYAMELVEGETLENLIKRSARLNVMSSAKERARNVFPTPVGPMKMNDQIGRRGSFYEEGRKPLNESWQLFEQAGNQREGAFALNALAQICLSLGDPDEAMEKAERSLEIRKDLDDKNGSQTQDLLDIDRTFRHRLFSTVKIPGETSGTSKGMGQCHLQPLLHLWLNNRPIWQQNDEIHLAHRSFHCV
jgi:hypothetical protein